MDSLREQLLKEFLGPYQSSRSDFATGPDNPFLVDVCEFSLLVAKDSIQ
jgi:hypothetical protein